MSAKIAWHRRLSDCSTRGLLPTSDPGSNVFQEVPIFDPLRIADKLPGAQNSQPTGNLRVAACADCYGKLLNQPDGLLSLGRRSKKIVGCTSSIL